MKNLATLKRMNSEIWEAQNAYRQAVAESLKETGELRVFNSDYDEDCGYPKGVLLSVPNRHFDLVDCVYDRIRVNDKGGIEVHICYFDDGEEDSWEMATELSFDDLDCIIDGIQWPESIEQGENDSDKELLVLCSTDEDNTKETYLTISKEDLRAGIHNERIVSELRKIFCVDDYVDQVGDEGEQEFQEAVDNLLQGRDAAFECYEWYWQTVLAL